MGPPGITGHIPRGGANSYYTGTYDLVPFSYDYYYDVSTRLISLYYTDSPSYSQSSRQRLTPRPGRSAYHYL